MRCLNDYSKLFFFPSIQTSFDYNWGDIYGRKTDKSQEAILNEGENIEAAFGRFNIYINQLGFSTNLDRDILLGSWPAFQQFYEAATKPGYVLRGICGTYTLGGIKSFSFRWGTVNGTCTD